MLREVLQTARQTHRDLLKFRENLLPQRLAPLERYLFLFALRIRLPNQRTAIRRAAVTHKLGQSLGTSGADGMLW